MDPENQEVKEVTEQEAKEKEKEVEVEDEGASDSGEEEEEEGEGGPSAAAFDLPPEGQEPNPEADLVASKLLGFLIKAFIDKTGREPNPEEVGSLLEEMTPERVAELLGGEEIVA